MMLCGKIRSCAPRISFSCIRASLARSFYDGAKHIMIITGSFFFFTLHNSPMMLCGKVRSCTPRISLSCNRAPLVRGFHDGAKHIMIITGFLTLGILLTLSAG